MDRLPAAHDAPAARAAPEGDRDAAGTAAAPGSLTIRHLRQILLWPLRMMPLPDVPGRPRGTAWELLRELCSSTPWREVADEYAGGSDRFHERHYNEFVTFLPYVQRFLYGEGRRSRAGSAPSAEAPLRVFRRDDIAAVRVVARDGDAPVTLAVDHVDLYFFYDVDVVMLNLELAADDLTLDQAEEQMYRFGRGYPAGWDANGAALHMMAGVEWLDAAGTVLATSDARHREAFLAHVAEHRAPRTAAHWAYLLQPLVEDHSDEPGALRYRQIEYYRMPMMAYLALDRPRTLTRNDFIRLGLVTGADGGDTSEPGIDAAAARLHRDGELPYSAAHFADFEQRYCFDRFWADTGAAPNTRYLCSGRALIVVGDAGSQFYGCGDRGVLAQFRNQHFMLFMIAHFQRAALLMSSDRLVEALKRLDVHSAGSVRGFKRSIRAAFEAFLRFTHRYWFHEISEQAQVRALFELTATHLGLDALYAEVKARIADMNNYLDADSQRRQANTVLRLTVVTILGLIGTVTSGFLGMNLLAEADAPAWRKLAIFGVTFVATAALTFYTVARSKSLSDALDVVSDERLPVRAKLRALGVLWRRGSN